MAEYGCATNNKFGFFEDDAEDPSALLEQAEAREERTPAQKKADKKAEKLRKEKEAAAAKAAAAKAAAEAAAAKPAGKENARPEGRGGFRGGRGGPRGAGAGGPRPPREHDGERPQFNGEGRGRGGPRGTGRGRGGPFRGRGGAVAGGDEHAAATETVTTAEGEVVQQTGDREGFAGRGRGGRGRGGFRGDGERPPREFSDRAPREFNDRPPREPRDFTDRPPRDFGDRPPRGAGRGGRGGRGGDRQSGSDRTGVKPVDAKGGHGKGNWGSDKEVIEEGAEKVAEDTTETKEEAAPPAPREKTAEELEYEAQLAEYAKQKTLAEFRAASKKEDAKFNIRTGGEDDKSFGKLVPIKKNKVEDEVVEEEETIVIKKEPKNKPIIIDFKFTESNRGGFEGRGRGGDRGRRGTGGPRGGRGAPRGGARGGYEPSFKTTDEAFPALGAH